MMRIEGLGPLSQAKGDCLKPYDFILKGVWASILSTILGVSSLYGNWRKLKENKSLKMITLS